jgi:hypothetical protein
VVGQVKVEYRAKRLAQAICKVVSVVGTRAETVELALRKRFHFQLESFKMFPNDPKLVRETDLSMLRIYRFGNRQKEARGFQNYAPLI